MRHLARIVIFIGLLFSSAIEVYSQESMFKDVTMQCSFVNTPQINAANVTNLLSPKLDWWLEIDVSYKTLEKITGRGSNKKPEWLDDVTFKYEILLPGTDREITHLSGKTTYWSIPLDGKEHHDVCFVHPRFLQRYSPEIKTTASFAKDINIKLTIELNGALIGGAYHPTRKAKEVAELFQKATRDPKITRVDNSIFSRDKTPWAILNCDYYELIKVESGR